MSVKGIFLISKPIGITSHDAVSYLRKITKEQKIGHAGTLDPLASGLLIIAIGREFTKQLDKFRGLDKKYNAKIKLGEISTTYDADGDMTSVSNLKPSLKKIESVLKDFKGKYSQMPPIFSAKKIKGQKAYNLARSGKKVELQPKEIVIHEIELLDYSYPYLNLDTVVSSGTYIRSLAHDIGQKLAVGAYLLELTRTHIGNYRLKNAVDLNLIHSLNDLENVKIKESEITKKRT